jgi:hypothetical protein
MYWKMFCKDTWKLEVDFIGKIEMSMHIKTRCVEFIATGKTETVLHLFKLYIYFSFVSLYSCLISFISVTYCFYVLAKGVFAYQLLNKASTLYIQCKICLQICANFSMVHQWIQRD